MAINLFMYRVQSTKQSKHNRFLEASNKPWLLAPLVPPPHLSPPVVYKLASEADCWKFPLAASHMCGHPSQLQRDLMFVLAQLNWKVNHIQLLLQNSNTACVCCKFYLNCVFCDVYSITNPMINSWFSVVTLGLVDEPRGHADDKMYTLVSPWINYVNKLQLGQNKSLCASVFKSKLESAPLTRLLNGLHWYP